MSILSTIGNRLATALNTLSGVVQNPVLAIKEGTKASTEKFLTDTQSQRVLKTLYNVGAVAGAVYAGGAIATKGIVPAVSSIIPKSTTGKLIAGGSAPILATIAVSHPEKTATAVASAPTNLANFQANIGNFASEPSLEGATKIATQNPFLTGATTLGGLYVGGKLITSGANVYSNFVNTNAIQDNTKALSSGGNTNYSTPDGALSYSQQKNLLQESAQQERKTLEAQTEAQLELSQQAFKQQKELIALQTPQVAPSPDNEVVAPAVKKKKKRKSKKKTKKKKKKTRRSKKKSKKKSIKRRKN